MSGEGTGGGGALAALLALWIVAITFIVAQDPLGSTEADEVAEAEPTPEIVEVQEVTLEPPDVTAAPSPTPRPQLPECEGVACHEVVTRAELAGAFSQAFRLPVTTADFFVDDADHPQQAAINRVAAAGITSGCGDGRFCPDGQVTRAQIATFLNRALALPEADRDYFTDDADLSHEGAINRIAAAGITSGCADDRFCPDGLVTLGQLIRFLERAVELQSEPVA